MAKPVLKFYFFSALINKTAEELELFRDS